MNEIYNIFIYSTYSITFPVMSARIDKINLLG